MGAAREQREAVLGLLRGLGLGQDAPADGDHRVGGEHDVRAAVLRRVETQPGDLGLGAGEPLGELARMFGAAGGLVGLGRHQPVGRDADLREQREAARRTGGKNEEGRVGHLGPRAWGIGSAVRGGTGRRQPPDPPDGTVT
ncbi:hypothetical protein A6302_03113 [Methylobrevis pamukkalensis]|uniref:Uncharacterized protein n=1 Tax=Methylobrevis pamukkalensis TaxID=1439726 RepID=A0A1E3GZR9_9HYPH|nr:hypothetical protein A6302_03113 [Methylobrevis pamukkalensis]